MVTPLLSFLTKVRNWGPCSCTTRWNVTCISNWTNKQHILVQVFLKVSIHIYFSRPTFAVSQLCPVISQGYFTIYIWVCSEILLSSKYNTIIHVQRTCSRLLFICFYTGLNSSSGIHGSLESLWMKGLLGVWNFMFMCIFLELRIKATLDCKLLMSRNCILFIHVSSCVWHVVGSEW